MAHDDLLRAASRLRDRLLRLRDRRSDPALPTESWERVATIHRRLQRAVLRGWTGTADRQRRALHQAFLAHQRNLDGAIGVMAGDVPVRVPPLRQLYDDLVALRDEFPEVKYDRRPATITVLTEPVELQGVYLGPFRVVLSIGRVGDLRPYEVVAVDPHHSSTSSSVPHPHVDGERLCEGDGTVPIERALVEGRPYDLFVLVDRILRTYNAGSAYVALSEWEGTDCQECGASVSNDEIGYCRRCECDLCDDCSRYCQGCDESYCHDCVTPCGGCGDSTCLSCSRRCKGCGDHFCRECLHEEGCPACRKATLEEENAAATAAEADAPCDGQAAVPA